MKMFLERWLKLSPHRIAVLSLIIATLTALAGTYQWWDTGRQERIRAAIDISNKHLENPLPTELANMLVNRGLDFSKLDAEPFQKIVNFYARLEYAAFLANQGLADERYFSVALMCDIVVMGSQLEANARAPITLLRIHRADRIPAAEAQKFMDRIIRQKPKTASLPCLPP